MRGRWPSAGPRRFPLPDFLVTSLRTSCVVSTGEGEGRGLAPSAHYPSCSLSGTRPLPGRRGSGAELSEKKVFVLVPRRFLGVLAP